MWCPKNNTQDFNTRLQNTIQIKTRDRRIERRLNEKIPNKTIRCNVNGNSENAINRSNSKEQMPKRFPVDNVSSQENGRFKSNDFQPQKAKQLRGYAKISTIKSPENTNNPGKGVPHDENRYLTSLLPCTDSRETSSLPITGIWWRNISNDLSSFRAIQRPINFFQNHQLVGSQFSTTGYKDDRLSGRFLDCSPRSSNSANAKGLCGSAPESIRMDGKQSKILNSTSKETRIFGNSLGHREEHKMSCRKESCITSIGNKSNSKEELLELARGQGNFGQTKFRGVCCTTRTPSLPQTPENRCDSPRTGQIFKVQATTSCRRRFDLVGRKCAQVNGNPSPHSNLVYNNRRSRQWVGCNSERKEVLGTLATESESLAQQLQRTVDSLRSPEMSGTTAKREIANASIGQPYSCSILNERRGNEITKTSRNNDVDSNIMSKTEMSHYSSVFTRDLQRHRGRSVTFKKPTRMDIESRSNIYGFREVRLSGDRSLCNFEISDSPSICKRRSQRHSEPIRRRFQQEVGVQVGLDFSPSFDDPEGPTPPQRFKRNILISSSSLGETTLENRSLEKSITSSTPNSKSTELSYRPPNEPATSSCGTTKFSGMDGSGWADHVKDWSKDEVGILEASWRASTIKTYKYAWKRWKMWASANNVLVSDPKAADLAKYLCFLHNSVKLAPRTILLHKSVVTTFANPTQGDNLNSHPLVKHVLKGIFVQRPPAKKPLSWKMDDLIKFLEAYPFEENLFTVSRHTAALLLLASGRRIHDLTLLRLKTGFIEFVGEDIIFWPEYGSKTDSSTFRQSGWLISSDSRIPNRLNLPLWIKKLIALSEDRRKSNKITSLFVTVRGRVKAASKTIISGWLRSLFKEAGIASSAGSFRSAVATDCWLNCQEIENILSRGNWRSKATVFKHYFKEVSAPISLPRNKLLHSFTPL